MSAWSRSMRLLRLLVAVVGVLILWAVIARHGGGTTQYRRKQIWPKILYLDRSSKQMDNRHEVNHTVSLRE